MRRSGKRTVRLRRWRASVRLVSWHRGRKAVDSGGSMVDLWWINGQWWIYGRFVLDLWWIYGGFVLDLWLISGGYFFVGLILNQPKARKLLDDFFKFIVKTNQCCLLMMI